MSKIAMNKILLTLVRIKLKRLVFAGLLISSIDGCRNIQKPISETEQSDSLRFYRIAIDYMQDSKLLPPDADYGNGAIPVYVDNEIVCPSFPIDGLIGYDTMKALAASSQYSGFPKVKDKTPCKPYTWPKLRQLSTTENKRIVVRFNMADSFSFAPLVLVFCDIYDNIYQRQEILWTDFTDYYSYAIIIDPRDSVVGHYGGKNAR